jgi:hypothetical protein
MKALQTGGKYSKKALEEKLQLLEDKAQQKWKDKWGEAPWSYAVVATLQKIPIYILVVLVVDFNKIKPLFTDPLTYLSSRVWALLVGFVVFVVLFRIAWHSKAFKYYLLTKQNGIFLPDDSRIGRLGRKAAERLPARYAYWQKRKALLVLLPALLLPVIFFSIMYLLNGIKEDQWTLEEYFTIYEEGVALLVFAIFVFFGVLLGFGIWREIRDNYQALQKIKADREQ